MKKFIIISIFIISLLTLSSVSANDNNNSSSSMLNDDVDNAITEQFNSNLVKENKILIQSNNDRSDNEITPKEELKEDFSVPSRVISNNVQSKYGNVVHYSIKVLDSLDNPVVGKEVKIKIGKHNYNIVTDDKGVANLNLNYNAGSYTIKYSIGGLNGINKYDVKNKVTFTILKWGNKGNVKKVKLLKKNRPNNYWVKKAVTATKYGNPLLIFKGGSGKKVFLTAGVHGNELSSQVAIMRLIKYLNTHPIKGTVYIIPFVNIRAITKKVRHTGKDYNRIAHTTGTIPNKIVHLILKYKSDAYGDFHTTKPGGIPGKNIVMGSKSPTMLSASLAEYMSKKSKVKLKKYGYAGQQYPTSIFENVNKKGIPSVMAEVMLPHGTVTKKTVNTSFSMMKSLLTFNSII